MKIIIAGGTGLVGQSLIPQLQLPGNELYVLGRNKNKIKTCFKDKVHAATWDELPALNPDLFDAIINLTGENIASGRWSTKVKKKLLSSRIESTQKLVQWATKAKSKKPHLYNASAIGIYGLQTKVPEQHDAFTEQDNDIKAIKQSFASYLVHQWEHEALKGAEFGIPITLMRFGVILKRGNGMLKKLELPTKFGLGAVVGSGQQPLAWIDHTDLVQGILFLLAHPEITGPVNLVAPHLTSQKEFTQCLAQALHKPAFLHLPSWFVHYAFGQMGDELLLSGQAVQPKRMLDTGFSFKYPTLITALAEEFK